MARTISFSGIASLVLILAVCMAVGMARPAYAQILYGGLVGNVTDSSQAAIPGAKVTVTNEETGTSRTGESNEAGYYSFPTIATGSYTINVEVEGFRAYQETGVNVTVNNVTRVDVAMEVGQVTEQITVASTAAVLQTDRAEVRAEVDSTELENIPVPLGRNYQMLLQTIPGFTPPRNAHSVPANPTRSVAYSVNGTSESSNNVRIDGVSSYNPNLTHMTGINPALEAIEVVNVVSNSFDAEQGLAGGAAINLQIKSGTNDLHGSAFWYNNNQHLSAYPYFSDRSQKKPKFIYNQFGATIGGPIKKNEVFFFASYEGTREHSNATKFMKVPTQKMREGDFSGSPTPIYNPFSGAPYDPNNAGAYARDREPFPGNIIPSSMMSPESKAIYDTGDWHLPNQPGTGALGLNRNYLASITYAFNRDQLDTKFNWNASQKTTLFARLSYLYYDQINPGAFGILAGEAVHPTNFRAGKGFGPTWSGTIGATFVTKPNLVFDTYFGTMLLDSNAWADNIDTNVARDIIGIPGTNGPTSFFGGMSRMRFDGGYARLGYHATSPFIGHDYQYQFVFNGNWTKGTHEVRFGTDNFFTHINQQVANANGGDSPAGGFRFRNATTQRRGGPGANDYNSMASFYLGLSRDTARNVLQVERFRTRSQQYSAYIRDRWQVRQNLTLTYGVRWEYYPFPVRADRGLEIYDFDTNEMLRCGVGSVPRNCGNDQSKKLFAPRLGIAWRIRETLVLRAGYGLTYDPFNLGRDLRGNYPTQFSQSLPRPTSWSWSTTLSEGIPPVTPAPEGERIPMPTNANFQIANQNYHRGYIQSWNLTMEKQFGEWLLSAGYVATRSVRQSAVIEANWADLGEGTKGRQLNQKFGRTAVSAFYGHFGTPKYDALQARVQRRFTAGIEFNASYTWSNSRGYTSERSTTGATFDIPEFYGKNYGPLPQDRRHNFAAAGVFELPFGRGKRWVQEGAGAAILGGWQINLITAWYTGSPVSATAPGTVLNAPPSGQVADCIAPPVKIGSPDLWWSPDSFANPNTVDPDTPRFGTCGIRVLRGPSLINFDLGVFRRFRITERIDLQFRAESFNISNTPHFGNPSANVTSGNFGVVTSMQNTGRDGNDQRFYRLGLRLGW